MIARLIRYLKGLFLGPDSEPSHKVILCTHCRYPNKEAAAFCEGCGDRLGVPEWER